MRAVEVAAYCGPSGYNITGIEGTPPRIENVQIHVFPNIGLKLDWCPVSDETKLVVFFDIFDNVGTDRVKVSMRRGVDMAAFFAAAQSGGDPAAAIVWESQVVHLGGARERSMANGDGIAVVFQFSLWGAAAKGTDVNVTAWDLNGNAAWGQFHVESLAEKIAKAIAAFFEAVAKVIMEALSFLANFVASMIQELFLGAIRFVVGAFEPLIRTFVETLIFGSASRTLPVNAATAAGVLLSGLAFVYGLFVMLDILECAITLCLTIFTGGGFAVLKKAIVEFVKVGATQAVKAMAKKIAQSIAVSFVVVAAGLDLMSGLLTDVVEVGLNNIAKRAVDIILVAGAIAAFAIDAGKKDPNRGRAHKLSPLTAAAPPSSEA